MHVELINTGSEILLGNTLNTHVAWLGQELFPLGLRLSRQTTVPDGPAIREALEEALPRAPIILVTGGLGPTTDDLTREITAELFGLPLDFSPEVMRHIEARFARRGIAMNDRVQRQAMVPRGATVLQNANGTAPGLYLAGKAHAFLLPGPPRELKPMFSDQVVPILRALLPPGAVPECRTWRLAGLGESQVEGLVGEALSAIPELELGYCARPGEVELRCIGLAAALGPAERIVLEKLAAHIVSTDQRPMERVLIERLAAAGRTLAVAESCTGGRLADRITNVPGASAVFLAGYVTYANSAKIDAIGVDPALIAAHGAVSAEVAAAMALGARSRCGADFALATTGIAGPGGGTEEKPVGTVFIALAGARGVEVERQQFPSDRETFKALASQAALDLLRRSG